MPWLRSSAERRKDAAGDLFVSQFVEAERRDVLAEQVDA
jgi:hypothetical protein